MKQTLLATLAILTIAVSVKAGISDKAPTKTAMVFTAVESGIKVETAGLSATATTMEFDPGSDQLTITGSRQKPAVVVRAVGKRDEAIHGESFVVSVATGHIEYTGPKPPAPPTADAGY